MPVVVPPTVLSADDRFAGVGIAGPVFKRRNANGVAAVQSLEPQHLTVPVNAILTNKDDSRGTSLAGRVEQAGAPLTSQVGVPVAGRFTRFAKGSAAAQLASCAAMVSDMCPRAAGLSV